MKYICNASFVVDECDGDGFTTGEMIVEKGEIFNLVGKGTIISGEIRLENDKSWIELSNTQFEKLFKLMEETENE